MEPQSAPNPEAGALEALARQRFSAGDASAAVELLRQAIAVDPHSPHLHTNLGITLAALGRLDEAIPILEQALPLQPGSGQIQSNLAQAHVDRGNALLSAGRFAEAIPSYERALALVPGERWALNNLGVALQEVGRHDDAARACRDAADRHPDFAEARYNLGRIYQDLDRQDEAAEAFEQALLLRPYFAQARNNLAMTLQARGRFGEAVREYKTAVACDPAYDDPLINLGVALRDAGRIDEAIAHYRDVLAERPELVEARWNLGTTLLLKGDLAEGFREAEARRKIPRLGCDRNFEQPQWLGEELGGKTILLHAEQGFGDAIQFIRYAPMVRDRGGRVSVLCQAALTRLFSNQLGIDRVVSDAEPLPAFDVHCPLLSLPAVFETTLATIPARIPYLSPDPGLAQHWSRRMSELPSKRKVGVAWSGNPRHVNDRQRSIPPDRLNPLRRVPDVCFISLQKPRSAAPAFGPIDFTDEFTDFADTAGLIANLDLVISADTAVAHLAGAMRKTVWTLLPHVPDWRWMLNRDDSPWYSTMRLFRQDSLGDWGSVIERVVSALL